MKKHNLLAVIALVSMLGLSACGTDADSSDSGNLSTPPVTDTGSSSSEEGEKPELPEDPYAAVLEGLDLSKDIFHDNFMHDQTNPNPHWFYGGYVDHVGSAKVGYGFSYYQSTWGKYGVAVKVTFTDGKVGEIKLGAPEEGVHNFTPSYGGMNEAGYMEYVNNYEKKLNKAYGGKPALSVYEMLKDVALKPNLTPTEEDSGVYHPSESDPMVVSGVTQTKARTDKSLLSAVTAYLLEVAPTSQVMTRVSSRMPVVTSATPVEGHVKNVDGAYGYTAYSSWGTVYGAAVKVETYGNNIIKDIKMGIPSKDAHNYSPSYAIDNPDGFMDFYKNGHEKIRKLLVGKKIDAALLEKLNGITYEPGNNNLNVPEDLRIIGTGSTQTDARLIRALYNALQGCLSGEAVAVDAADEVNQPIAGMDFSSKANSYNYTAYGAEGPYADMTNCRNGYYDAATKTAYGISRYENKWSKGKYYGAAVKMVFDDAGKIASVKIGVPEAGDVNMTPSYIASNDPDALFLENYLQYLNVDANAKMVGLSAYDVFKANKDAVADGTSFIKGEYDFVGFGAMQTTARIDVALREAAGARFTAVDYDSVDPYGQTFSELNLTDEVPVNAVHQGGKVVTNGANKEVYGYTFYGIAAWYSTYGSAVKLTIDASDKITKVELGRPTTNITGGAYFHFTNFTGSYGLTFPNVFVHYLEDSQSVMNDALVGKTVDQAFAETFAGGTITINPDDLEKNSYSTPNHFLGASATQSDTRVNISVYNALQKYLESKAA